jgi:hypothetical protein
MVRERVLQGRGRRAQRSCGAGRDGADRADAVGRPAGCCRRCRRRPRVPAVGPVVVGVRQACARATARERRAQLARGATPSCDDRLRPHRKRAPTPPLLTWISMVYPPQRADVTDRDVPESAPAGHRHRAVRPDLPTSWELPERSPACGGRGIHRGLPPSFRHSRREMGSRQRQPVPPRPQTTCSQGCRSVRDAEVAGSNPAHPTFSLLSGHIMEHTRLGYAVFSAVAFAGVRTPAAKAWAGVGPRSTLPACAQELARLRYTCATW